MKPASPIIDSMTNLDSSLPNFYPAFVLLLCVSFCPLFDSSITFGMSSGSLAMSSLDASVSYVSSRYPLW